MLFVLIFILILNYNKQKNIESFQVCGRGNLNRREIWTNTKDRYGEKEALNIFPQTYIFPQDLNRLIKNENKQFILKTLWGSFRKGVKLYDNKKDIIKNYKNYDIGQVYIKNPLLVNGFKFDIRYYVVVYCGKGIFLYKKAYNVYTKEKFNYSTLDRNKKINQIDPPNKHYVDNNLPRTIDELSRYKQINFNRINIILSRKLKKIFNSCKNICCPKDMGKYNIFGVDVELLSNLDPIIIEINSTPSLKFSEPWKSNLVNNMKLEIKEGRFGNNWIII